MNLCFVPTAHGPFFKARVCGKGATDVQVGWGGVDTLRVFVDINEARLVPGSVQLYCGLVYSSKDVLYAHC